MRRLTTLCLAALLAATAAPPAAHAALTWAQLDPGNDWAAQVIQGVFPLSNSAGGPSTGTAATVIGTIVQYLTTFVLAIAAAYVCYTSLMHIHRGAETSRVLSNSMTTMFVVRLGFAAVLMWPVGTGFSVGQQMVVQVAMWGIGAARMGYATAVTAIGPDSMAIATPEIPGTEQIVAGLIRNELCRDLINLASNNAAMMPPPVAVTLASSTTTEGYVSWIYSLAPGNKLITATCGTVKLGVPASSATSIAGVSLDMTGTQQTVLNSVLASDIQTPVQQVAQQFWTTRQAAALTPLMNVLTAATADYTNQLTTAATTEASALRTALTANNASGPRTGDTGLLQGMQQLSALGWTQAGAYYLMFARMNGETLSLLEETPTVNPPNYLGLPPSLKSDLAPLVTAEEQFMADLMSYVQATDGTQAAGGGDHFTGATAGAGGLGVAETTARALGFNKIVLGGLVSLMSPSANMWTDPFSSLVALGHKLIGVSLTAFGLAGLLSSNVGTILTAAAGAATGGVVGALAGVAGHLVVQFLAGPIFMGCMALLVPGMVIAFVLPMIPYIMWIAGVAGWLILVCEAVIMVPMWMLAHMTFEGEGLHGQATEGWGLLFNVLFRPVLMLIGLFVSYFVFTSVSWMIRTGFGIAAGFAFDNGDLITNILGVVVMTVIFVLLHVVTALLSFRLITLLPHHLPRMAGFASANRVDMEEFSRDAAYIGALGGLQALREGFTPGRLGNGGAGRLPGYKSGGSLPRFQDAQRSGSGMDSTLQAATENGPATGQE